MSTHGLERFDEQIPIDHECQAEACPCPPGFYVGTIHTGPGPRQYDTKGYVHNMSAAHVIAAMIQMMDQTFQDNRSDDTPPLVAFARGRDLFKTMLETQAPPGDVSAGAADLLELFNREDGDD